MKNRIDKLVLILFVLAMCFLMTVSAKAETGNSYFFRADYAGGTIELPKIKVTPVGNVVIQSYEKTIFNKTVNHGIRVSYSDGQKLSITTEMQGVLLLYYARAWDSSSSANDANDLKLSGQSQSVAHYCGEEGKINYGIKYFTISGAGDFTLSTSSTCRVYGFVFMPGNVAAYDVKGKGNLDLIGGCCDSHETMVKSGIYGTHYLEGWYKDEACTQKITQGGFPDGPTVIFANWVRCVWDFAGVSSTGEYDGMTIVASNVGDSHNYALNSSGFQIYKPSTDDNLYLRFVPQYDGELTVSFKSTNGQGNKNTCVLGTSIQSADVLSCGETSSQEDISTLQVILKKGITYYVYTTTGGVWISKLKYVAAASSAEESEDRVTLTTTANMQGWRAFYEKERSYTLDEQSYAYLIVDPGNNGVLELSGKLGHSVPADCPVLLHNANQQADGTYKISMTPDKEKITYNGNDNLLCVTEKNANVEAFRLGYRSEGGITFYPWKSENADANIVYIEKSNHQDMSKLSFDIVEDNSGKTSSVNMDFPCPDYNEDKIFNVNGQRLAVLQKGLNIINGKKVIVR